MSTQNFINDSFKKNKHYSKLINLINENKNTVVQGVYGSSKALVLGNVSNETGKSLLVLTSTAREAEEIFADVKYFYPDYECEFFPSWEIMPYERISPFTDIIHHRVMVLHKITLGGKIIVVSTIQAALQNIIPLEKFKNLYLTLSKGEELPYDLIIEELVHLGYKRKTIVEASGEFTVKGDIIDIFPSSMENPVRIDFFGDTIERIRVFDAITQRSTIELENFEILPQRELIYEPDDVARAIKILNENYSRFEETKEILEYFKEKIYFNGVEHLIPFFYEPFTLFDYLSDAIVVLNESDRIKTAESRLHYEHKEVYSSSHKYKQIKPLPEELYDTLNNKLIKRQTLELYYLTRFDRDEVVTLSIGVPEGFKDSISKLSDYVKIKLDEGFTFIAFSSYEGQTKRLYEVFSSELSPVIDGFTDEKNIKPKEKNSKKNLILVTASLSTGFILNDEKVYVILDREIFGRKRSFFKKIHKVNSKPIESFLELNRGDHIVHINYGIGKFHGIERIKAYEKEKDYIKLIYADNEKLYIPIEQMNLVQKYIGGSGKEPVLDKLGSKSWEKTKSRVKKALQEMAGELANLYKARLENRGIAHSLDTDWQLDFEAAFPYDETPDQLQAIIDVKKDMESLRCMDRLVCGDVGYGKTEVCMRACFKTIMNGMQAAVLVPTTILSEQHYETFTERFKNFPVKINMLSRFCTASEMKKTAEGIKKGSVDLVIGTHRLLSNDIEFKNLGLVIIDEEQKFGVRHKEKLKKLRAMVDVISLSATPIPRTLHMSLASIRDISIINTPPENRLPIDTHIMEFNEDVIKDAINKEVKRGGQVFFVHNRVRTIRDFANYLLKICPNISVGVAHGQMDEKELEDVMHNFINAKYDVLVATTIIESGLDIPNANTIIIDRADSLGLSQLYQLRGRVGRSKRKAYCYLFYPPDVELTEIAQKRLSAIREFTDLGSGFKIAMKDLEIRGAGNILGPEQSGDIASVGFELYCKLLKETVDEVIGGTEVDTLETYVDLRYDGYIPDDYISDEKQKFEIYKKIVGSTSVEDVEEIKRELIDRFGDYPPIVESLLTLSYLKVDARKLRILSVIETSGQINIEFDKNNNVNVTKLLDTVKKDKSLKLNPQKPNSVLLIIDEEETMQKKLNIIRGVFSQIKNN